MASDTLILYGGVPLDPRYEHTLKFQTPAAQTSYFNGKVAHTLNNYSYLRKGREIKVSLDLEGLLEGDVSYCSTESENGKRRYYFITSKEYVSDGTTRLYIDLDVLQTYQFDWTIPACFVEREHVASDEIGEHLLDEGLELGDYVSSLTHYMDEIGKPANWAILVQSSVDPDGNAVTGRMIQGVYSGVSLYATSANTKGATLVNNMLKKLSDEGKADGVLSIWMYPKALINSAFNDAEPVMALVESLNVGAIARTARTNLDGYTPRNKKLYCHPYSFLYCSNNYGESAIYKYEYFDSENITFEYRGTASPDASVKIYPRNYRGMSADTESGLTLQNFPTCAWTQDAYKIWMAQNQNQQAFTIQSANVQGAIGAAQVGAGAVQSLVTLGHESDLLTSGAATMYSAYQQVSSLMAQRKDAQIQPPQSKGVQSASVNATIGIHTFTFSDMSVDAYHAKMIDEYFDMYGYKINRVQVPTIDSRPYWNYIKTIGCVVTGNIDAADRRKIATIFDKGVTFWHKPASMYDYSKAMLNKPSGGVG